MAFAVWGELSDITRQSSNFALLLLRLGIAAVMMAHGINHIFGGGKIRGTARWFEGLGMKPGIVHAWVASLTEIGSALLIAIGLATPIAAAGVVGVMLVALITNHLKNGFFIFRPGEGWEYVAILSLVAVALGILGPGNWSIDGHVSGLQTLWGWTGLAISLGAGAVGAGGLLVTCWRPERGAKD